MISLDLRWFSQSLLRPSQSLLTPRPRHSSNICEGNHRFFGGNDRVLLWLSPWNWNTISPLRGSIRTCVTRLKISWASHFIHFVLLFPLNSQWIPFGRGICESNYDPPFTIWVNEYVFRPFQFVYEYDLIASYFTHSLDHNAKAERPKFKAGLFWSSRKL